MKRTTIVALIVGTLLAMTAVTASAQSTDPKARLQIAEKIFKERCKKAGEFIHRTVENVEGILLMKIRPVGINYGEQFALTDPYGNDSEGDSYIKSFLAGRNAGGYLSQAERVTRLGYRYVEAVETDGKRYRYTGGIKEVMHTASILMGGDGKTTFKTKDFVLDKVPAPGVSPRHGVTYDDISTSDERQYWIAGSSLKVIDLKTNEVMAERIGYMMDRGQGNKSGGRSPWLLAADNACPGFRIDEKSSGNRGFSYQAGQTRNFVEKTLKPIQER